MPERLTERQREILQFISASIDERGYPPTLREIGEHFGIRSTNGVNDHLKALEKKGYLKREDLKSRAMRPVARVDGPVSVAQLVPAGADAAREHSAREHSEAGGGELAGEFVPGRGMALGGMGAIPLGPARAARLGRGALDRGGLDRGTLAGRGLRGPGGHEVLGIEGLGEEGGGGADAGLCEIPILGRVAAGQPLLAVENQEDRVRVDRFFVGPHAEVFGLRVCGDSMIEDGILDGDFVFVKKTAAAGRGDIVVAMIEGEATLKRYYPEGDIIRFQPANCNMEPILVRRQDFRSVDIIGVVVGVYRRLSPT